MFCRAHAVQLHRDRERFEDAGVRLVVIGQGEPEDAAEFQREQGIDLPLHVDTDREAYDAAGAKMAVLSELLGPRSLWKGLKRARAVGVSQGRTIGHPSVIGGALLVASDGSIPWSHMSREPDDLPDHDELIEAGRSAKSA